MHEEMQDASPDELDPLGQLGEILSHRPCLTVELDNEGPWALICRLEHIHDEDGNRLDSLLYIAEGRGKTLEEAAEKLLANLADPDLIAQFIKDNELTKTFLHAIRESEISSVFKGCDQTLIYHWGLGLVCYTDQDLHYWELTSLGHRVAARIKGEWP